MTALTIIYYFIIHLGFISWTVFAVTYGTTRKFEATPQGVNMFLTSVSLSLVFGVLVTGIWWQGYLWRVIVAMIALALIAGLGVQRAFWLRGKGTKR